MRNEMFYGGVSRCLTNEGSQLGIELFIGTMKVEESLSHCTWQLLRRVVSKFFEHNAS